MYEFLSGVPVTPTTSFVDVGCPDVAGEYGSVVHFMRYALAAYGWPMYLMTNTGTGLCRILPKLRYEKPIVVSTRVFFLRVLVS